MAISPTTEWRKDQIPAELIELRNQIEQLPLHLRTKLLPLTDRLYHYTRLHSRLLRIAQEAVDQLQLEAKCVHFDLDATRKERDEFARELGGYEDVQ
jgi:hypothetical protein